jgi:hypothetical protein
MNAEMPPFVLWLSSELNHDSSQKELEGGAELLAPCKYGAGNVEHRAPM